VHANLAFREPLLGDPGELPPGRRNGRPWHRVDTVRRVLDPGSLDAFAALARPGAKGLIVAGAGAGRPENIRRLAVTLGWPVLADPRSGARTPGELGSPTVAAADALLRVESFAGGHVPEFVLRLGQPWASKAVAEWLTSCAGAGAVQVLVDPYWAWQDPRREADVVVPADPDHVMQALMLRVPEAGAPGRSAWAAPLTWSDGWAEAEAAAQHAIESALGRHLEVSEPGLARALYAWSPPSSTVVTSSSMPVRDLEWFAAPRSDPPRVLANRGANGIDGVTSTTLGVTAAGAGTSGPVVGLLGDLAFLHDSTALVRGRREPALPAVLVVVDNGGGGIFSFLPQASELDEAYFERLFGTPQRIDVADLARAAGCDTTEVASQQEIPEQLDAALYNAARRGPAVVVVRSDRKANLALHTELEAEVALALG
jgi:2-succinyl-5-enolpyruvyl-6-hydroxy-3-cyclohexene-1-carboxylate synthase